MKKQKYYSIIITIALLFLYRGIVLAQTISDTSTNKLADRLSVSQDKAVQIQAAYNYHSEEILALIKNRTISPKDRQRLLNKLMAERQQKLNTAINPALRIELYKSDTALINHLKAQMAIIKQRYRQTNLLQHQQINLLPSSSVK